MAVEWLKVTATCQQEITIGTGATRAFMTPTNDFIPGSVVRGALAKVWRLAYGDRQPLFRPTFDGAVRFGPLLAQGSDVGSQSVWRCKYHRNHSEPEHVDGAFACPHCGRQGITDPCPACGVPQAKAPSMCSRPGEPLKGAVAFGTQVKKVVASTAIHPDRMTALESSLFAREVFPKGTVFSGYIVGDTELNQKLREFPHVTLGGRRSVLGSVELSLDPTQAPEPIQTRGTVILRTISPTILVDDTGAPTTDVASAFPAGKVERIWGGRLTIDGTSGWHAASGLPKPGDLALAPGIVVALSGLGPDHLRGILDEGIGVRRPEGFGWLEVVEAPWRPPQRAEQGVTDPRLPDTNRPDLESFTPRELKWLAGWLRDSREWNASHYPALWDTTVGKNLNHHKRTIVRSTLETTAPGTRTALASELERS
ncbi:CRISPR-associated protein Csx10 [Tessaracoccus bendigoensis DSM 12906]|uniref:CRISPR-associated protein Csx10 n=1 Tax=Tessaracoccus bendigoensis DSM 12906 TaxID=1123357 RepID=A0A1M6N229_9ACTN|nr:hypothetical protein [Tessaracoccus bendigoensis]SHJ89708.1 CRISPR-associated protein Csx10 [Tessaracoccus bendigoensis DSM 12906]